MMSICKVVSWFVGKGFLLWPVCFLDKILVTLCPALFRIPRPNLPVTPNVSWLPTFAFQSPMMKRTSSFGVLEDVVCVPRTSQFQLLQHQWFVHRLGLQWCWRVCLGNKQRLFCRCWDCIQVLHFGLLLTMMATPFLLRDLAHSSSYNGHLS